MVATATKKKTVKKKKGEELHASFVISAPNMKVAQFTIGNNGGGSPYVQNKFSHRAKMEMIADQEAGSSAKTKRKNRKPKEFGKLYEESAHKSAEGWYGIPAPSIRNALIDACRLVNFTMTKAKLCIFVLADGHDPDDGTPLVKILGEPRRVDSAVRLKSGVIDIRPRPHWDSWKAIVRIHYDADQFKAIDIAHLLMRAGFQVGIGAGRHSSKDSYGLGWGCFEVIQ